MNTDSLWTNARSLAAWSVDVPRPPRKTDTASPTAPPLRPRHLDRQRQPHRMHATHCCGLRSSSSSSFSTSPYLTSTSPLSLPLLPTDRSAAPCVCVTSPSALLPCLAPPVPRSLAQRKKENNPHPRPVHASLPPPRPTAYHSAVGGEMDRRCASCNCIVPMDLRLSVMSCGSSWLNRSSHPFSKEVLASIRAAHEKCEAVLYE